MNSELKGIHQIIRAAAIRKRLSRAWAWAWIALLVGIASYLAVLAIYKIAPIDWSWVNIAGAIAITGVVLSFVVGWFQRVDPLATARWIDREQGLKDRLSTALELEQTKPLAPSSSTSNPEILPIRERWYQLIVADAQSAASQIDLKKLAPLKLPGISKGVMILLAITVGLGFVPEYRSKKYLTDKTQKASIKEAGQQLAQLTRRSIAQNKPVLENTQKALEEIAELGEKLQQPHLTRESALKDLASATDQLKKTLQEVSQNPALKRLEKAARTPGNSPTQSGSSLQKQMDALQKQLGEKAANRPDAIEKMQKEMEALKESAKGLSDKNGADGAAARAEMAQAANELARQAESVGMPMPNLDSAIAALQSANVEQFLKDINVAAKDLEKLAEMSKALSQMQMQAERMGKDLAEQLENGQAQAAVESLQRLRDALNKATPEEMKKILDELSRSLKSSEQYGKLAEKLAQAKDGVAKGDRKSSQGKLDEAKAELEKLLEEMGDAQSLMASLENLQKAQMCVGANCPWGQCRGKNPGFSPGKSKGGKGYGTWAEDNPWAMPDKIDDFWQNDPSARGDMQGKGQSERAATVPNTVVPTKVKGQMQPGGSMPSITLRGVSIKGQSTVGYTEASAAAQSDAQAALNQEKVPRAYQNAVKDYFDDLKK